MKKVFFILFAILLLLNVYDIYSTNAILKEGGKELNPIVDCIITHLGVITGLVICKGTMFLLFFAISIKVLKDKNIRELKLLFSGVIILILYYGSAMYFINHQILKCL